ncbi:hypothetical protein P5673_025524 [Acropora cervicornis]|uniref:Uncharacterized protein n=1 Tax=Acropora cervicornis TaxID=6130 RepID=A0AAD9Q1R5_ACRCE|nr:hypothetical protein P5673_025524 [Acropora cervicornis]
MESNKKLASVYYWKESSTYPTFMSFSSDSSAMLSASSSLLAVFSRSKGGTGSSSSESEFSSTAGISLGEICGGIALFSSKKPDIQDEILRQPDDILFTIPVPRQQLRDPGHQQRKRGTQYSQSVD